MLPHTLTEGEIPFVWSANGNGNGISLKGIPFPFVSVKQIFESSVSVKTNFESSVNIPLPLMALCFYVTHKELTQPVEFH